MPQDDIIESMKNEPGMPDDFEQELDSMILMLRTDPDNQKAADAQMMLEMFLGGDTKMIIHAPGKIEFTNQMNAVIDGNTVTIENNILQDLVDGKISDNSDIIIKYK